MKKNLVRVGVPLLVCAGLLLLYVLHVFVAAQPPYRVATDTNLKAEEAHWQARIGAIGGKAAYGEFAQSVAALSPELQHQSAHTFGGALYETEGTKGLSVCDIRFSYGCFHEFLGRAISALGLGVVPMLNQGCVDALGTDSLSCQHGIGHGVLAYLGYSNVDLKQALGICHDLPYNDPIGGCYGGVFMEYNLQIMLGKDAQIRQVKNSDMQFPCDSIGPAYQPACLFWQPQWWHQTMRQNTADEDAIFKQMGKYCDQVEAPELIRQCYEGIGNIVPPSANFDGTRAAQLCQYTSSEPLHQLFCKSLAANSLFVGGAGAKGDAQAVCAGLTGAPLSYCSAYARNEANIANEKDIQTLSTEGN
jgi:hypothetical protein